MYLNFHNRKNTSNKYKKHVHTLPTIIDIFLVFYFILTTFPLLIYTILQPRNSISQFSNKHEDVNICITCETNTSLLAMVNRGITLMNLIIIKNITYIKYFKKHILNSNPRECLINPKNWEKPMLEKPMLIKSKIMLK